MRRRVYRVGGARIGSATATHPFAVLKCSSKILEIEVMIFGTWSFSREQVAGIHKHTHFLSRGIRIEHIVPEYPEEVFFYTRDNLTVLLEEIDNSGFIPRAHKL